MAMEKFHYKLTVGVDEDGDPIKKAIVLPKFGQIKFGIIRKNRKLPQQEQFFALLEEVASQEVLDIIDEAYQESMQDMMTEWQKESGVSMGESEDSSS